MLRRWLPVMSQEEAVVPPYDRAASVRERFDAQRLGLAALERVETYLMTTDSAQHIHKFERSGEYHVRHVANQSECWLCVQLGTIRAALDNAYERSLPPVLREVRDA
jgi:hypothetical protein